MDEDVLKSCIEKGFLLDKETLKLLEGFDKESALSIIEKFSHLNEKIITKAFIIENVEKLNEIIHEKKLIEKIKISFGVSVEIAKFEEVSIIKKAENLKENYGNLKILSSPANIAKKIKVSDFVKHYRNRYNAIKKIFQGRKEVNNLISINKINDNRQNIFIIGIVLNKRLSKNKNLFFEVEDLTGKTSIIVTKDKPELYEKAKNIIVDDIIAIKCVGSKEISYANEIFYPDSFLHEKNILDRDESAAFVSDIHIGSKNFLKENFLKFIRWLNCEEGDERQKQEAKKVKYLFITGDCVDGVGVFPGQETLLDIKDVKEQYNQLAFYLRSIRKDIQIIMCPGQHDAVRIAEPQPAIGNFYGEALYELDNVVLVNNPSLVEIASKNKQGMRILMYHGASMNSFVDEIESLRLEKAHERPSKVVREILKRRHLAPIHASVTYIPNEKEDYLVINDVPDIINTADFHRPDVDVYNNILIICSSCWQSITQFEEKVGNVPEPCKVPVLNLKTREIKIMDFSE